MNPNSEIALITGASTGIGYELARLFARDHYDLILVARNAKKLDQIASDLRTQYGTTIKTIALDLTAPSAAQTLFDRTEKEGALIDVLINNAGYGVLSPFAGMEESDMLGQLALNITTLTHLTRLFLPGMIARRRGKIMNVASTAAFQPGPLMSVYFATKAYVLSFSEALANEVSSSGVVVCCFCPGATVTEFQKRAGLESSRLFKKLRPMDAKTVADDGYRGLMSGKTLVISGFRNWLTANSVRFAPRKLVTAISRWVAENAE